MADQQHVPVVREDLLKLGNECVERLKAAGDGTGMVSTEIVDDETSDQLGGVAAIRAGEHILIAFGHCESCAIGAARHAIDEEG